MLHQEAFAGGSGSGTVPVAGTRQDEGKLDACVNNVAEGFTMMAPCEADCMVRQQTIPDKANDSRVVEDASDQAVRGESVEGVTSTGQHIGHEPGGQPTSGSVLHSSKELTQQEDQRRIAACENSGAEEKHSVQLSDEGKRSLEAIVSKTKDRTVAELETAHQRMHRIIVSMIHCAKLDGLLMSLESSVSLQ